MCFWWILSETRMVSVSSFLLLLWLSKLDIIFHFLSSLHSIKDMFLRLSFKQFMPYAESLSDFMQKKTSIATEQDLLVDLTFHSLPASLLTEFAQKIVRPHYKGNINAAIQDLLLKALSEQDFVLSHITHVKTVR
jgi:hypothetical protein